MNNSQPRAAVTSIEYHLPERRLTNQELAAEFPEWGAEKIAAKTGIRYRHIAAEGELSSDLAYAAAIKLFGSGVISPREVDYILFCTQTPDFAFPTTACLLQQRLGIPTTTGALDFNLGCSGYVYGLSLAKALVETGQATCVLFLTGETYSKLLDPADKTVRTIFGDAGTATVVRGTKIQEASLGPFIFGTDGSGGSNLVCHRGGWRGPKAEAEGHEALWMNGPEIFNFTLRVVPAAIDAVLTRAELQRDEVDLFVFHQANQYMLEQLRKKLGIPEHKFLIAMADCGNTVSNSIPIALRIAHNSGRLKSGHRVLLVGFGVGYSWGATLVRWHGMP